MSPSVDTRDEMTQLLDRRSFEDGLREQVAQAKKAGRALALVLLDIDYMKRLNDEHGRPAGDAAIHMLTRAIREATGTRSRPASSGSVLT